MAKNYKNDLSKSIHTVVEDLYKHGIVDKITLRRFDASCLLPNLELAPKEIKALREKAVHRK